MFEVPVPIVAAVVAGSYLVGTTPTAQLVGKRWGLDPTRAGSGNPGASNVYRLAGRRAGALVLVVDLVKGSVPTALGYAVDGRDLALACGVAAVLGHVFPLTRRLRGGKGVATAGGVALVVWPLVSAVLFVVFVAATRLLGVAAVGSLAMAAGLPLGTVLVGRPGGEVAVAVLLAMVVVLRHTGNIWRLVHGEEHSIRRARTVPPTLE